MKVDRIVHLPITAVWKHEAKHLTPWLCENIDVLSEAIGINLTNAEREQSTGSFNVDIKAEDEDGHVVIIENQFGASDHDHLGKILTYRTAFEAKIAVWIVESAKQEHVAAIGWLNQSSVDCDFYLVKIEAIKIGESDPAAQFTLISGPSETSRAIGKIKKDDSERHKLRLLFWTKFLEVGKARKLTLFGTISPRKDSWIGAGSGRSGITYVFWVNQDNVRLELRIDRGKDCDAENLKIFRQIALHKDEVEKTFGSDLFWDETEGFRMCAVRKDFHHGGYRSDPDKWAAIAEEATDAMARLEQATKEIVKNIIF